jgi:porin
MKAEESAPNDAGTALANSGPVENAASNLWQQKYMLNWGPERDQLARRGVKFDFFYVIDSFGVVSAPTGTRREYNGWGRIRGTVDIDLFRFGMPSGMTYHATGLWQYGQNMGAIIGSIANPSGLVSIHTFRLDSMWIQQSLFEGKLQLKAGQFATEDFYGIQEYGSNFLIEPLDYAFGNLGNVRASWDPSSSPAGEIKITPIRSFYLKTGYYAPRNYSSTGFNYRKTDTNGFDSSSDWNAEVGYITFADPNSTRSNYRGLTKVGSIYNGGKFTRYPDGATVKGNFLIYAQGAQPIYRMSPGSNRGLDFTAGISTGPSNKSKVPTEATFGVTFNGPITARPRDAVSVGVVRSGIADDYNKLLSTESLAALSGETAVEVNYKAQMCPWLLIQPTVQYYDNVGGHSGKSAAVAGFRLKVNF